MLIVCGPVQVSHSHRGLIAHQENQISLPFSMSFHVGDIAS